MARPRGWGWGCGLGNPLAPGLTRQHGASPALYSFPSHCVALGSQKKSGAGRGGEEEKSHICIIGYELSSLPESVVFLDQMAVSHAHSQERLHGQTLPDSTSQQTRARSDRVSGERSPRTALLVTSPRNHWEPQTISFIQIPKPGLAKK